MVPRRRSFLPQDSGRGSGVSPPTVARPCLFLLNQTAGTIGDARDSRLFRCGTPVDPDWYADIYRIIGEALAGDAAYSAARAELYRYTYAHTVSGDGLRARFAAACDGPAPAWLRA